MVNRDPKPGEYGSPNPQAPHEFSQFAFIIGAWRCDVTVKGEGGTWQPYEATWIGRYILDGNVIADEYRMTNREGDLVVHGMNFRFYSVEKKSWVMRWLSAAGMWTELGSDELGGVSVTPESISFNIVDPVALDALSRITFSNITDDYFKWKCEQSFDEGKTWAEFVVIDAHRSA